MFLPDAPSDGLTVTIKDGDLNAGTNNITVRPDAGGSDTIDEGATYVMNANGESITLIYDAGTTDYTVISGYVE